MENLHILYICLEHFIPFSLLFIYLSYKKPLKCIFLFQSTEGPCSSKKPSAFDFVGKAKWEAWNTLGAMSQVIYLFYFCLFVFLSGKENEFLYLVNKIN